MDERATQRSGEEISVAKGHPSRTGCTKSTAFQVGKAVECLHSLGYAHRDLKPDNIMKFGEKWKLIDFDSVCQIGEDSNIAYTPRYAAPEVVKEDERGERKIKVESEHDMWSLGVIAYEVFSQGNFALCYAF